MNSNNSNNNYKYDVDEEYDHTPPPVPPRGDGPVFRAVVLHHHHHEPSEAAVGMGGTALKASPFSYDKSSTLSAPAFTYNNKEGDTKLKSSTIGTTSTSATAAPPSELVFGWKKPVATRLSFFHPLEHYHRQFPNMLQPLLHQLVQSFKSMSFKVHKYTDSPVTAYCESMDQVRLQVSIWITDAEDENNNNAEELIVEIQRVQGDSILFGRYAREILSALLSSPKANAPRSSMPLPPFQTAPDYSSHHPNMFMMMQPPQDAVNEHDTAHSACDIALGMLLSERYDARELGLNSLVLLTDPWQSGDSIATFVSRQLTCGCCSKGGCSDANITDLQTIILSLALKRVWPALHQQVEEPASEKHTYLALMALTRAFQVMATNARCTDSMANDGATHWLPTCLDTCQCVCQTDLIACLVDRVVQAADHPHEASFAVLGLVACVKAHPNVSRKIPKSLIEQALMVGCSRHAALETASEQLLVVLQAH